MCRQPSAQDQSAGSSLPLSASPRAYVFCTLHSTNLLEPPRSEFSGPISVGKATRTVLFLSATIFLQQFGAGHRSINTVQPFRVATLHDQTQGGGAMVVRDVKAPKKTLQRSFFRHDRYQRCQRTTGSENDPGGCECSADVVFDRQAA